ncbi:alanine racemase [Hansschlegelia plantiphila]|uniref:Alanine racemase n=1 Tax=Hansschlegelia plantiphila TaxID=374655 RepID=A0A9W6J0Q6_9HYPH|nr:alanine racemase [Hansschlegelia plantiphila]GLK67593.1 alanine racemase [Hansschlegelia plantiphila]
MISDFAGGRLTIDLGALQDNWRVLSAISPSSECAAVVKADAYGVGLAEAAQALAQAGVKTFFVAHLSEARTARAAAPDAAIYVLNGLPPGACDTYAALGVRPVLGSMAELAEWRAFVSATGADEAAAIHVDTGMARLGLDPEEARALFSSDGIGFRPALVMSHLACADEPDRPETERQRALFAELRSLLPNTPASLANSPGTLIARTSGGDLGFEMRRPGVSLYGSNPLPGRPATMKPVVKLEARIIQTRHVPAGTPVGYGGAETTRRPTRLAILSLGYADGVFRAAGSEHGAPGAFGFAGSVPCPFFGRISMDLVAVDVTDAPESATSRDDWVEILGDDFGVDDLARACGTIGYEVLTALGRRYERRYVGAGHAPLKEA